MVYKLAKSEAFKEDFCFFFGFKKFASWLRDLPYPIVYIIR